MKKYLTAKFKHVGNLMVTRFRYGLAQTKIATRRHWWKVLITGMVLYVLVFKHVSFSINIGDGSVLQRTEEVRIYPIKNDVPVEVTPAVQTVVPSSLAPVLKKPSPSATKPTQAAVLKPKPMTPAQAAKAKKQEAYVKRFASIAVQEMKRYGIPASITLAQGLIESDAGDSPLSAKNNNHFGIKCFSKKCAKGHCSNHEDDSHKDFFRIYTNPWESYRAHSLMLINKRYGPLKSHGKDYKAWAHGLKEKGYATDKRYAYKLIALIERFDLSRFDK